MRQGAAGGVQMMLEKDTVAWRKGLMVLPPGVSQMLHVSLGLLDRLAAMELTVTQPPLGVADWGTDSIFRCAAAMMQDWQVSCGGAISDLQLYLCDACACLLACRMCTRFFACLHVWPVQHACLYFLPVWLLACLLTCILASTCLVAGVFA